LLQEKIDCRHKCLKLLGDIIRRLNLVIEGMVVGGRHASSGRDDFTDDAESLVDGRRQLLRDRLGGVQLGLLRGESSLHIGRSTVCTLESEVSMTTDMHKKALHPNFVPIWLSHVPLEKHHYAIES
jgi:hypothetical protein